MRWIGRTGRPASRDATRRALQRYAELWATRGFGPWALTLLGNGRLVGQCGLFPLDGTPEMELAYLLAREAWGRGIATEAAGAVLRFGFEALGLEQVVGVTWPENAASRRVLEKAGLRHEGNREAYGREMARYALTRSAYRPDAALRYAVTLP